MSIHDRTSEERIEKCAKNGSFSESLFKEVLQRHRFQVFDATKEENAEDHIDFWFITPESIYWNSQQRHSVDVKGIKDFSKCGFSSDINVFKVVLFVCPLVDFFAIIFSCVFIVD